MGTVAVIDGPVLIVDDDALLRRHVALIMASACDALLEAPNGAAALQLLAGHHVALVITDLIMPRLEGVELIRIIREKHPETAVLAISGGGSVGDSFYLNMTSRLGADGMLQKPFGNEDLRKAALNAWSAHLKPAPIDSDAHLTVEPGSRRFA